MSYYCMTVHYILMRKANGTLTEFGEGGGVRDYDAQGPDRERIPHKIAS